MLASLLREGPASAEALAASRRVQEGRAGAGDPVLTPAQVQRWLGSARGRGFIVIYETDLDGRPVAPPEWVVGDAGHARLRTVTGLRSRVADLLALVVRAPNGWRDAVQAIQAEDEPSTGPAPPPRAGMPGIRRNPGDDGDEDAALANLGAIDHIVVLMMENRSFDQMLGYLDDGR